MVSNLNYSHIKILLSAFEVFGNHSQNPTEALMQTIPEIVGDLSDFFQVKTILLPVTYKESWPKLKSEIDAFYPDYIICMGLSGVSDKIKLETTATNDFCNVADNQGVIPKGNIVATAPFSYQSSLPNDLFYQSLKNQNIPVELSQDAGSYVCNFVMFNLLNHIYTKCPDLKGGFIHVPPFTKISLEDQLKTINILIDSLTA